MWPCTARSRGAPGARGSRRAAAQLSFSHVQLSPTCPHPSTCELPASHRAPSPMLEARMNALGTQEGVGHSPADRGWKPFRVGFP